MVELDNQSLEFITGGVNLKTKVKNFVNDPERNQQFMDGFNMFPHETSESFKKCLLGKNTEKEGEEYSASERVGQAVGMFTVAATVIGVWEFAKFTLK